MNAAFRTAAALAAIAICAGPAPTVAQSSHLSVTFVNLTPQCVWMTFYAGNQYFDIIKENGSHPQMVHPYKTIHFTIGKRDNVRMRTEVMYSCSGAGNHVTDDTQFTNDLIRNKNAVKYELHRNFSSGKAWLSASWT